MLVFCKDILLELTEFANHAEPVFSPGFESLRTYQTRVGRNALTTCVGIKSYEVPQALRDESQRVGQHWPYFKKGCQCPAVRPDGCHVAELCSEFILYSARTPTSLDAVQRASV
jgi:hypothetical protein